MSQIDRKLDLIIRLLAGLHFKANLERKELMALQPEVQDLIDKVAANTNAAQAAADALKAEQAQIADLQAQIANIVPGQPIDAEDLAAIKDAAAKLGETNVALQTAVPANTPAAPPT